MRRILVTGSGGTPAANYIRSMKASPEKFHFIGVDSNKYYLQRSETDERYLIPRVDDKRYWSSLKHIIEITKPDFVHSQPDVEIPVISKYRKPLLEMGVRTFLPKSCTIEICMNKVKSYRHWAKAGLPVPKTILIKNVDDLREAFNNFDKIWLREIKGAFGKGSLRNPSFDLAKAWIDFNNRWGIYAASEFLGDPKDTVTWSSIWKNGELVVAQGRKRVYWEFANRTQSGVTGLTGTGVTVSDQEVDEIAHAAILSIDRSPNGIFSVDLTYNEKNGIPNPTEINIGRFFTTHYFFTAAGLNMPYIALRCAFDDEVPFVKKRLNPLTSGLAWVRGLDFEPILTSLEEVHYYEKDLNRRLSTKE
jgi:carbamoyl-phosphate synthase large subunit